MEKKSIYMTAIVVLSVFVVIFGGYFVYNKMYGNKTIKGSETYDLLEVTIDDKTIRLPASKKDFEDIGWTWDEAYADKEVKAGFSASGGRIGTAPGGVVVSVMNTSEDTKKVMDCVIDDATFYNPEDENSNITFVGGITFNSTEEEVKATMEKLGYVSPKVRDYDTTSYYNYYLNDNQNDFKNYIEFYFVGDAIKSVSIKTSGN